MKTFTEAIVKSHISKKEDKKKKLEDYSKNRDILDWNKIEAHILVLPLEKTLFKKIDDEWSCNEITGNPLSNCQYDLLYSISIEWLLNNLNKEDYKNINFYIIPDNFDSFDELEWAWAANDINIDNLQKL